MSVKLTRDMKRYDQFSHLDIGSYSYGNTYFTKFENDVVFHLPNDDNLWHRLDGPASMWNDGQNGWWFNNIWVASYNTFDRKWSGPLVEWANEQGIDLDNLTDSDVDMIKLCWSGYAG